MVPPEVLGPDGGRDGAERQPKTAQCHGGEGQGHAARWRHAAQQETGEDQEIEQIVGASAAQTVHRLAIQDLAHHEAQAHAGDQLCHHVGGVALGRVEYAEVDDAQTGVKNIFSDKALEKEMDAAGFQFSSANSINIGRLCPQIVYYVYAYTRLLANGEIKKGEKINVVVPTGNFGNILAAFYAKNMGLPINKLICASNENKVLFDFFKTGEYDRNREFVLTTSPSMDILVSSNLERLIYMIAGNSADKNAQLMNQLKTAGKYTITDGMRQKLSDFYGNFASEEEDAATIKKLYEDTGYVIDTHTAVAAAVYDKYKSETKDDTKTVIASTASPFKFTRSVLNAIDKKYDSMGDFELVDELSRLSNVAVPAAIEEIRTAPVLHNTVCDADKMCDTVKKILGI